MESHSPPTPASSAPSATIRTVTFCLIAFLAGVAVPNYSPIIWRSKEKAAGNNHEHKKIDKIHLEKDHLTFVESNKTYDAAIEDDSSSSSSSSSNGHFDNDSHLQQQAVNYLRQPDKFVQIFRDCANDDSCHFTYHHVSKTGGTAIEQTLFPFFGQRVDHSCCHTRMMYKFDLNPELYCSQKFTSWQVNEEELWHIVSKCQKAPKPRRTVVLTTFREPITTYLSLIHQMCNKNWGKRSNSIKHACTICDYQDSTSKVFDKKIETVEKQIRGSYDVAHWMKTGKGHETLSPNTTSILTLEPNDLDAFWKQYQPNGTMKHSNAEILSTCSFRPPVDLIKRLRPAEKIYRSMVSGEDLPQ